MVKSIIVKRNGNTIEYEPIVHKCTYHSPKPGEKCQNCNDTGKYVDGYYMIVTDKNGHKTAFIVDNIK